MVRGTGFPVRDVLAFADTDRVRVSAAVRALVATPRFREAVTWQSRSALTDGMDRLGAGDTSKQRRRERLVASYAQRYCTKNDSIGFFGPFGYGEIDRSVATIDVRPGPTLLARRRVYFEQWAIDVLAEALVEREALHPYVAPRLMPIIALEGTTVRLPTGHVVEVDPSVAAVLARSDGVTPAFEIARALLAEGTYEFGEEDDVYALLESLAAKRFITWTLEVPGSITRSEDALATLIDQMPPSDARDRAAAAVARLSSERDALGAAAGDPTAIAAGLDRLDATFRELTGQESSRRAGETYAARGTVYEDCRRDLALTLGADVLARTERVLALLGVMARWFTHEIATRIRAVLHRIHAELGGSSVRYLKFWTACESLWNAKHRERSPLVDDIAAELSRRWTELLQIAPGDTVVERTSAELDTSVFAAPSPGWPAARHVAPDLLFAARGLAALHRGELVPVVGEVHVGNTLLSLYSFQECPDPAAWIAASDADLGTGRVSVVEGRRLAGRADAVNWSKGDLQLETGPSRAWRPREQVLRVADLVVENRAGTLVVVDHVSGRSFDVIVFFEQYIETLGRGHFKPQPSGTRLPRVTIDGVIVSRAQWTLMPDAIPRPAGDRATQFAVIRRWAAELGLPRHVFVRVPHEVKPMYIDFESPLFVEVLMSLVREASTVTIVEMVPAPDETWLPDHAGQTYACELRLVAVDPVAWRAP
jgi:Lantibiotic dehydratase, N terminus